ncbi:hypothetical protein Tco_1220514 [Tanacetum coccineum]
MASSLLNSASLYACSPYTSELSRSYAAVEEGPSPPPRGDTLTFSSPSAFTDPTPQFDLGLKRRRKKKRPYDFLIKIPSICSYRDRTEKHQAPPADTDAHKHSMWRIYTDRSSKLRSVKQKDNGILISQDKYVADILKKFDFTTLMTSSTPMEPNKVLIKDAEVEDVDVHLYRSMIGSLMYLTASRPNIMFVVYTCARFQVTPKVSHLHAVKMIFRYLKGQPKLGLWYPRDSPFDLEAFSDSDYAGASLDKKSTIEGCQFLDKRLISWQCKKQTIVANSTTEAKYVDAANCCGQSSGPIHLVADETVIKEWEDRMERAATTASSLEAEQDSEAQIRFEAASKQSNDPPLSRVNTLGSGEDNMKLKELMEFCTKLSVRAFDL